MKVLAISGSLRAESYNTALARAAVELAPEGVFVDLYDGLALLPPYDQDLDEGELRTAGRGARPPRAHRSSGRAPDRHARVQRLDARSAEERDRLGVGETSREARSRTRRSQSRARRPGNTARSGRSRTCAGCSGSAAPASIDGELPVSTAQLNVSTRRGDVDRPAGRRAPPHASRGTRRRGGADRGRSLIRRELEKRRRAARSGPSSLTVTSVEVVEALPGTSLSTRGVRRESRAPYAG